jgi:hypothetical protein
MVTWFGDTRHRASCRTGPATKAGNLRRNASSNMRGYHRDGADRVNHVRPIVQRWWTIGSTGERTIARLVAIASCRPHPVD